jgi:hypothetical protein
MRKLLEGFLKHQSAQNPIGKNQLRRVGRSTGARTHSLRPRRLYNMNEHDKITDQGMHSISVMKCISLNLTIGIPMDSYGGKHNVFFLRYSLISKAARRFARIWAHNTPYYHNPYRSQDHSVRQIHKSESVSRSLRYLALCRDMMDNAPKTKFLLEIRSIVQTCHLRQLSAQNPNVFL